MTLLNYTPHSVNLPELTIPSVGVARIAVSSHVVGNINGIEIRKSEFGSPEGLPDPQEDTLLIVSALVAAHCPERQDLLVPDGAVRDDSGRIIGCTGFATLCEKL